MQGVAAICVANNPQAVLSPEVTVPLCCRRWDYFCVMHTCCSQSLSGADSAPSAPIRWQLPLCSDAPKSELVIHPVLQLSLATISSGGLSSAVVQSADLGWTSPLGHWCFVIACDGCRRMSHIRWCRSCVLWCTARCQRSVQTWRDNSALSCSIHCERFGEDNALYL